MTLISCENLQIGYDGHTLTAPLTFSVEEGAYVSIVGENGAGKSTLMKTMLGILPPLSGKVKMEGSRASSIGYLPQQTLVQRDFPASVREIVLSGCQGHCGLRPFYNKKEKLLAADNMRRLGIDGMAKKCYRDLSGGQQQRVLLARALCAAEKILFLDEPVSGLDPAVTQEMYETIAALNKSGMSILMISHDIPAALTYSTHILQIGEDFFFGTTEDYRAGESGRIFCAPTAR